jgi:4,5-dihydroxyphthalate decarboxylase
MMVLHTAYVRTGEEREPFYNEAGGLAKLIWQEPGTAPEKFNNFDAFARAKGAAYQRMENPRRVPLAWFREAWEEQEEILGMDPWAYGLHESNRKNLGTLIRYAKSQGLIQRQWSVDELFDKTVGGEEWKLPGSRG